MRRLILAVAAIGAAALLSACSADVDKFKAAFNDVTSASVSPKEVVIAASAYDVVAITATNYQRLPRCTGANGPICRDPSARKTIDGAIYSGRSARNSLKAYMRAHPGEQIGITDYNALKAATDTLSNATAAYRAATQ